MEIVRRQLDNGLRVVVLPDRRAPVVAVAVFYDVGFRSEPEGRTGFAHLFEHMMFQGSRQVPKGMFDRLIMGNGGVLNGMTSPDYTVYYEIVPTSALDVTLFLEADRMRALDVSQENLDNQIAVVEEEIRMNVLNRPYGRFPWLLLPSVMFDTFPNTHDGYGSFDDLEAASLEDVRRFFRRFYAPSNALVVLSGDVDPGEAGGRIESFFGDVPTRRKARTGPHREPPLAEVRRAEFPDPLAPAPALALGYRAPDPADLEAILAIDVFTHVLADGKSSRLQQRLLRSDRSVTSVDAWVGEWPGFGPLDMRDPTWSQIVVFYPSAAARDRIIAAIDEEVARALDDLGDGEVERVVNKMVAGYERHVDDLLQRALTAGPLELQRDASELVSSIPEVLLGLDAGQVKATAAPWFDSGRRVEIDVRSGP